MRRTARVRVSTARSIASIAVCCAATFVAACVPASNPLSPDGVLPDHVPAGAYFLRTIDDRPLPMTIPGGVRIETGFVVADSVDAGTIGFGESLARASSSSASLATGTAKVLGQDPRNGRIAAITWRASGSARADSVLWSVDSVIVYRTGAAPSAVGAGHRLVYTRAVAADTL